MPERPDLDPLVGTNGEDVLIVIPHLRMQLICYMSPAAARAFAQRVIDAALLLERLARERVARAQGLRELTQLDSPGGTG